MVGILAAYIKTITALTLFTIFAELLLPDGKFSTYLRPILGILVLSAVLQPLFSLLHMDLDLTRMQSMRDTQTVVEEALSPDRMQAVQDSLLLGSVEGGAGQ